MTEIELVLIVAVGVISIFVLIDTILLLRLKIHYDRILKSGGGGLMEALEGIQKTLGIHEGRVGKIFSQIAKIEDDIKSHLQHLVVRRFNPFSNTGGDQSFIVGILDGNQNGIVITSLHSRENTRFYVKSVSGGEGDPHPLSDEEKKVLKKGNS
ncbi:MAG: DUF4446 family protein [bacterium]